MVDTFWMLVWIVAAYAAASIPFGFVTDAIAKRRISRRLLIGTLVAEAIALAIVVGISVAVFSHDR
jgi:MFS family permease